MFRVLINKYLAHSLAQNSRTMCYRVEPLPDSLASLGEGPHWDAARQSLYYVDLPVGGLLRYDYRENKVYRTQIEGEKLASFVLPVESNLKEFAVGCGRRAVIVNWDGVAPCAKVRRTLFEVQPDKPQNRFNDAKTDPSGRLFAGTMLYGPEEFERREGELYRWQAGGKVELVKSDVGISNGLAWDKESKKFYYVDTTDYEVKSYCYDIETGCIDKPKVIYNFRKTSPKDHIQPDGMTIDTDGNIYVATFNDAAVYKIDPRCCKLLQKIKLPTMQITSVAFGGPNLDILYVTTGAKHGEPAPAGTTYQVMGLNVQGYAGVHIKI
ncbi:hypothetical protein KR215_011952 [Drosophila sulfurigaster]|nr:hypothetical protein KR215_011952 [Drosophila sulfurigaster]